MVLFSLVTNITPWKGHFKGKSKNLVTILEIPIGTRYDWTYKPKYKILYNTVSKGVNLHVTIRGGPSIILISGGDMVVCKKDCSAKNGK